VSSDFGLRSLWVIITNEDAVIMTIASARKLFLSAHLGLTYATTWQCRLSSVCRRSTELKLQRSYVDWIYKVVVVVVVVVVVMTMRTCIILNSTVIAVWATKFFAIPRRDTWDHSLALLTSTPLCQHRSPGRTSFQTFHHRRPAFSGCRLTVLELTARNSRFDINSAPAPIENFPIWSILHSLAPY